EGSSHYTLRLFWSTENLAASDEDALRIRDALSGKFPDLGKRFKGKVRKIVIAKGLTAKGVVEAATRAAHDVDACVSSARSSLAVRLAAEAYGRAVSRGVRGASGGGRTICYGRPPGRLALRPYN